MEISNNHNLMDVDTKLKEIFTKIANEGLDSIFSTFFLSERWLEMPRKNEIMAVINRMRNVTFKIVKEY